MQISNTYPTGNFTRVPNFLLDLVGTITPSEFSVLMFMVRKNLGYQNPNRMFAVRYLAAKLDMGKDTIMKCLNRLMALGLIKLIGHAKCGARLFDINQPESSQSQKKECSEKSDAPAEESAKKPDADARNSRTNKTKQDFGENSNKQAAAASPENSLTQAGLEELEEIIKVGVAPERRPLLAEMVEKYGLNFIKEKCRYANKKVRERDKYWLYLEKVIEGDGGLSAADAKADAVKLEIEAQKAAKKRRAELVAKTEAQRHLNDESAKTERNVHRGKAFYLSLSSEERAEMAREFLSRANSFQKKRFLKKKNPLDSIHFLFFCAEKAASD